MIKLFYAPGTCAHALHAVKEASYKLVEKVFTHLDQHLEGKTHVVGNRRTVVDAYAFAMIRWGNYLPKPLSNYPRINHFYHQMLDDKDVKRAMEQQGIQ
jgi:glutathione S-transferase